MKRALLLVVVALAGVVIGLCLAWLRLRPAQPPAALTAVTVPQLRIDDGPAHWAKRGFFEMTPPVRLPSDELERDHIAVWLQVPEGKTIGVRVVDGRPVTRFPPGTTADRVETFTTKDGTAVVDVRGTTLVEGGELWHVFVPTGDAVSSPLVGWEWRRNDDAAQRAVTDLLVRHLSSTRTLHELRQPRRRVVAEYERNNACGRCHAADQPEDLARRNGIHRATDDEGWYVPLSVLSDTAPLEHHRAREMNVGDPFMALECPLGRAPALDENDEGARRYRCDDGSDPVATLDVTAALKAHDPHAVAVCGARAYLKEHMDDDAKKAFSRAFSECGL